MVTIALMTDFGTRDHYVASMKGVIASRCVAPIHDLTHDIAPFDVFAAAWYLGEVWQWWPEGTIFVAVIDPGVGTARRILAAECEGRIFLAPDNGLLTFVPDDGARISVEHDALFLPGGSNTFHGRDRFAPVAAALANGASLASLGRVAGEVVRLPYDEPSYGELVRGRVVDIDRFGNLITDIEASRVPFAAFRLLARDLSLDRIERNYGDAAPGAFMIVGSTGRIEISVANGSAAELLRLRRHDRVELRPMAV